MFNKIDPHSTLHIQCWMHLVISIRPKEKTSLFPVARTHLIFLPQITPFTIFIWTFFKNQNHIAYFEVKSEKTFVKNFKYFPEICFFCLNNLNNNQLQCIWAVKHTNTSFAFEILANNIKMSLQCLNKSLKKNNKKKKCFSDLKFFLTCYGKQTCFLFWPYVDIFVSKHPLQITWTWSSLVQCLKLQDQMDKMSMTRAQCLLS